MPFAPADFPPAGSNDLPGRDRKRTFEEANSSSGTPTELASPTTARKEFLGSYEPAQLAMRRPPGGHKASSRDGGSRASSPLVSKHKRRRVDGGGGGGGSDAASLPKMSPPRSPALLPGSPFGPLPSEAGSRHSRDRHSQERSREATPKPKLAVPFSSSDEEDETERRRMKKVS